MANENGEQGQQNEQGQQGGEQSKNGTDERMFTQSDVDKIVQERLARAKPADYDELKAKAQRLDEIEEANATEQEKALKQAREETRAEVTAQFQAERVADKIEVAASGKFHDVQDARLRLSGRVDEFISEDGTINTEAIASALDKVLDESPHLKKDEQPGVPPRQRVGLGTKGGGNEPDVKPGAGRLAFAYASSENSK